MNGAAEEPTSSAGGSRIRPRGQWALAAHRLARQPVTIAALTVLVALFIVGGLAHEIAPQGWNAINLSPRWANQAPTWRSWHLLGTDNIGRDVLVRTVYGLHDTESIALLGALIATLLALAVGTTAGFYGGWPDALLMRVTDLVIAFPAMILMLAAFAFFSHVTPAIATLIFAAYLWASAACVVRARVASLSVEEYVQAAHALGASDTHILTRHVLPNATGTLATTATALIGQIILLEATVEFFGFGVASQVRPTLGNLIGDASASGIGSYNSLGLGWWVWGAPAIVLVSILICTNLIGDGLDTALNPRQPATRHTRRESSPAPDDTRPR